ncbi:MAG TPA: class I SAM-dependent methyltransferase [Steroidobacteraceae bacterium]|jgi:SAM-dependent methyltransferase
MFFKEKLHERRGRALELGCGSGNNLLLFAAFGWEVVGLDISAAALSDARHNLGAAATLIECDLAKDFPLDEAGEFDAILLPNILYYVPRESFGKNLSDCKRRASPDAVLFLRARTPDDWRYRRGVEEEPDGYRLECRETGEYGLLNVFYTADQLEGMVRSHFGALNNSYRLFATCDNPQSGIVVRNADVIIWGRSASR